MLYFSVSFHICCDSTHGFIAPQYTGSYMALFLAVALGRSSSEVGFSVVVRAASDCSRSSGDLDLPVSDRERNFPLESSCAGYCGVGGSEFCGLNIRIRQSADHPVRVSN